MSYGHLTRLSYLHFIFLCLILFSFVLFPAGTCSYSAEGPEAIRLKEGWCIHPSAGLQGNGQSVSSPDFNTKDWYKTSVPSTVMGALVRNKVYSDLFTGQNMKQADKKQFEKSWWYRTQFKVPAAAGKKYYKLEFDGINYRANVWMNGKLVAGQDSIAGAFRQFQLDVTNFIKTGSDNVLAVEVIPPVSGEPTIGFVDWNPRPPDSNMGIWREVILKVSGDVSVGFPFVKSSIDLNTLKTADLTVTAELTNNTGSKVQGTLHGEACGVKFSRSISLNPHEKKIAEFSAAEFQQLRISNPRLWWTYNLGTPYLYTLKMKFEVNGKLSDKSETKFGIREVSDYLDEQDHRGYKLNGKKILIAGGGWVDNIFLDQDYRNLESQVKYTKHMGLNTIRLEGFWGSNEDLYDLCDQYGILLMAGWSCQWEWKSLYGKPDDKFGCIKDPGDIAVVSRSWSDQIRWLRNHPSIFVWVSGSDKIPRPELEKNYMATLKTEDPTRNYLNSAKQGTSEITGKSGVKMNGPYEYVPPVYWWIDKKYGGAYGFNTETGPGPQVPPVESIKKFIPADHLWPIDSIWNYHCGGNVFNSLKVYSEAISKRLGEPTGLDDYCTKAQFINYEGMRAMFESFQANKFTSTGIIQWMLNASWPKLWWQLYDFYLMPNASFYGAKKANEPLHIAYNYGTNKAVVINNTGSDLNGLTSLVKVIDYSMLTRYSNQQQLDIPAGNTAELTAIPALNNISGTYFISLKLKDKQGNTVSDNFYTLSAKPDELDFPKSTWYYTPVKEYSDMSMLNSLPKVKLDTKSTIEKTKNGYRVIVETVNNSKSLAFQICLSVVKDKDGSSVLPIFWEDNYFSLLPGEKRIIKGTFEQADLDGSKPEVAVTGWNIE